MAPEQSEEYIEDSADNQDWKQKSQSNGKQQEEQQETRQGDPCAAAGQNPNENNTFKTTKKIKAPIKISNIFIPPKFHWVYFPMVLL